MSRVILMLVLFHAATKSRAERVETYTLSTHVWDKVNLGKRWQAYIQVMTYDLLHSSSYRQGSPNHATPKTLLDMVSNLTTIATNKHPCRMGVNVTRGRQINGKFFVQHTNYVDHFMANVFRICGLFSFTYNPSHYIDESNVVLSDLNDMDLIYPGHISEVKFIMVHLLAGEGFRINCTVLEFTAPRLHGCADGRVNVELFYPQEYFWFVICPNWGKRNFVAPHITLSFFMHYYQKPLFIHLADQDFTKLAFHYQILDFNNQSLTLSMHRLFPRRQKAELETEYMLGVHHFNTETYILSRSSSLYVGTFSNAVIYAFTLYTKGFLTPVISRANVTCNMPEAEIIFYDGPVQTFWQPVLPLLARWSCSKLFVTETGGSDVDEVRGSVGELNLILFMPRVKTHESSHLTIAWHAERMLPDVLRIRTIVLDLSTVRTIHFQPTYSTSLEVVYVQAPKEKFVHLGFPEMSHSLHSGIFSNRFFGQCLDGFEIKDPRMNHTLGKVCSNATAQSLLDHYQVDGFTVGQEIILKRKQYLWLGTISALITASTNSCAGYINLRPQANTLFSTIDVPGAMVTFDAARRYLKNGTFVGYEDFRIVFKRLAKACIKLQIVPFNELMLYELELGDLNQMYSVFRYWITSEDLTSPARFVMDFSSIGDTLHFESTSSLYGLRIFSLNNRFVKHALPRRGLWDTEAYSAEIGLHSSSLTHAAGLTVQAEEGRTPPVCTYEHTSNITVSHILVDLLLLGTCARAEWTAGKVYNVLVHKIYEEKRCCQFEGHITAVHSIEGEIRLYLLKSGKYEPWIANTWDLSGRNSIIKFHVLCAHLCSAIVIGLILDKPSFHALNIAYLANLIEHMYPVGVTFQLAAPKSPLALWNQVCHNQHCYITPRSHLHATWEGAKNACEEQEATLASINRDFEWDLLTRLPQQEGEEFIEFYIIRDFIIFYIGLVADVSTKHTYHI